MIEVRIHDVSQGTYQYKPTSPQRGAWTVIPRVGDYILDLNEVKYQVLDVMWYEPYMVKLKVVRCTDITF